MRLYLMRLCSMTIYAVIFITSTLFPLVGSANCEQARADFQAAQNADNAQQRLVILERTLASCPTFSAWYLKGRSHIELGQADAAVAALEQANAIAEGDRYQGLALGRLGEAYMMQGNSVLARSAVDAAYSYLGPQPPPWLERLRLNLDRSLAEQTVSAADIEKVLSRSFHVIAPQPKSQQQGQSQYQQSSYHAPRIDLKILFSSASDRITWQGEQQVRELGRALLRFVPQRDYRVRVIGHTDARGDEYYNQRLSERRALTVIYALTRDYPQLSGTLIPEGRGEQQLRYRGWSAEVHRLNRRVEVELINASY